jgi:hypothetical protein
VAIIIPSILAICGLVYPHSVSKLLAYSTDLFSWSVCDAVERKEECLQSGKWVGWW